MEQVWEGSMRTKSLLQLLLISVMAPGSILWATHEGFTEHAISTSADVARSVHAADVDGDGDLDPGYFPYFCYGPRDHALGRKLLSQL